MKKILIVLLFGSIAFANTSNLFLTCTDDDVPTPYGAARIILDVFKATDGRYSSTMELFIESMPSRRFHHTEFSTSTNAAGTILMPKGKTLEIATDGTEIELPNAFYRLGIFSIPGMENVTEVFFSPDEGNDLAIEYYSENCTKK